MLGDRFLISLGRFLKITQGAKIFGLLFPQEVILTKNTSGYTLGDFSQTRSDRDPCRFQHSACYHVSLLTFGSPTQKKLKFVWLFVSTYIKFDKIWVELHCERFFTKTSGFPDKEGFLLNAANIYNFCSR
jgi:hypothetical protein